VHLDRRGTIIFSCLYEMHNLVYIRLVFLHLYALRLVVGVSDVGERVAKMCHLSG
jgi:hypothetical protein